MMLVAGCFASAAGLKGGTVSYNLVVLGDTLYDNASFYKSKGDDSKKSATRTIKMWSGPSQQLLTAAKKRAAAEKASFVIQLGDLINGRTATKSTHEAMLRKGFSTVKGYFPKLPLLVVKGDFETRYGKVKKDNTVANKVLIPQMVKQFKVKRNKNCNAVFRYGFDLFIVVDGFVSSKECVAFVKKALDDNPQSRYVFFLTHLPVLPASVNTALWLIPGHRQIAAMLEKRNTLVLTGNYMQPSITTRATANGRITQLAVNSIGSSWRAKVTPTKIKTWDAFAKATKGRFRGATAARNRRIWNGIEKMGTYTHRQLFNNSGFVILDINDQKVEAHYYTSASAKPAAKLLLMVTR